jgi:addiction module HigA family antidote
MVKRVLEDAGLTPAEASVSLGIPFSRLTAILTGRRPLLVDTAMRLARYFGTSAQMWMNMQSRYDLEVAEAELADRIASEVRPYRKTA